MTDIIRIDPDDAGDDSNAALDAALAEADEIMLTAISGSLDLDTGLTQVLRNLDGPSAPGSVPAVQPQPRRDRVGQTPPVQDKARSVAAKMVREINVSDRSAKDKCHRARNAAFIAAGSAHAGKELAAAALTAAADLRLAQAQLADRRAPLPRQASLVLMTVALDAIACYFSTRTFGGSNDAAVVWTGLFLVALVGGETILGFYHDRGLRAWRAVTVVTGLFITLLGLLRFWFVTATGSGLTRATAGAASCTAATAGFLALGYRALYAAETPRAWHARRRSRKAQRASQAAWYAAARDAERRNRLIAAYIDHAKSSLLKLPAEQQPLMDAAFWELMLREHQTPPQACDVMPYIAVHVRDPGKSGYPPAGAVADAAALVLAVIETRSACITLWQLLTDRELADSARCVVANMTDALLKIDSLPPRIARQSKRRTAYKAAAYSVSQKLISTISTWEKAEERLCQVTYAALRLTEVHWCLQSLPEASGVYCSVREVITDVGNTVSRANALARMLERSKYRAMSAALGQSDHPQEPEVSPGIKPKHGASRSENTGMLIASLNADLSGIARISGELALMFPRCAKDMPLDQLAALQVDASGADLSAADFPDLDILDGIIWTPKTTWPPGIERPVRSRSRQIRPGVYQVRGGNERDPAYLATV